MLTQEENTVPNVYKVVKGLAQPTIGVGQFSSNIHAQNSCLQHAPEIGVMGEFLSQKLLLMNICVFVCLFLFFFSCRFFGVLFKDLKEKQIQK